MGRHHHQPDGHYEPRSDQDADPALGGLDEVVRDAARRSRDPHLSAEQQRVWAAKADGVSYAVWILKGIVLGMGILIGAAVGTWRKMGTARSVATIMTAASGTILSASILTSPPAVQPSGPGRQCQTCAFPTYSSPPSSVLDANVGGTTPSSRTATSSPTPAGGESDAPATETATIQDHDVDSPSNAASSADPQAAVNALTPSVEVSASVTVPTGVPTVQAAPSSAALPGPGRSGASVSAPAKPSDSGPRSVGDGPDPTDGPEPNQPTDLPGAPKHSSPEPSSDPANPLAAARDLLLQLLP